MAGMTDYLENKLIDHLFRGVAFSAPTALYIGLLTAGPTDSTAGTEVTGGGYARVALAPSTANWAATNAAGSTANPSAGTSGTTSNNSAINFPVPSANWGTVTHVAIYDSLTTGNMLWQGELEAAKTVNNGDPAPSFAAGVLTVQIDN